MQRRGVLAGSAAGLALSAGCSADPGSVGSTAEERVTECEDQYVRDYVVTGGDESIVDLSGPVVTGSESRDDGEYFELETEVGTTRPAAEGSTEHVDYFVVAAYLLTDEAVYRTRGTHGRGSPRDGVRVDC